MDPAKCTSRHIGNQLAICLLLAPLFVLSYLVADEFLTCVWSHDIPMKKTKPGIFSGLLFQSLSFSIPSSYVCILQTLQYTVKGCRVMNYLDLISEWMCAFSPHSLHFHVWRLMCKNLLKNLRKQISKWQ